MFADTTWAHAGPAVLAACLSFVEFVEALTIMLAVGTVRGWRCCRRPRVEARVIELYTAQYSERRYAARKGCP